MILFNDTKSYKKGLAENKQKTEAKAAAWAAKYAAKARAQEQREAKAKADGAVGPPKAAAGPTPKIQLQATYAKHA